LLSILKSAVHARPISRAKEEKMDFSTLKNYVASLALLYAWTLFAAGLFWLGERFCRGLFAQKQPAPSGAKDPAKR
jgi:hypothetical protein